MINHTDDLNTDTILISIVFQNYLKPQQNSDGLYKMGKKFGANENLLLVLI